MKTILKVLYITIGLIATVIIFLGLYSNEALINHSKLVLSAIQTADETQNYDELAKCFGMFESPVDGDPVATASNAGNKDVSVIYCTTNKTEFTYTVEGEKNSTTVTRYEDVYLFFILHPKFQRIKSADGTNCSGIRFYGENDSWLFKFDCTAEINSQEYASKPATEEQASLYGERTLLSNYAEVDMIFFPLAKSQIELIENKIGSSIKSYNIVDNQNQNVYASNVEATLDFSQQFFYDMGDFVTNYNTYIQYQLDTTSVEKTAYDAATVYLTDFSDDRNKVVADYDLHYITGISQKQVYTGFPMISKCIGYALLMIAALALVYFALFHIATIRNFVKKYIKKEEVEDTNPRVPHAPKKKVVISKAKVVDAEVVEAPAAVVTPVVEEAPVVAPVVEETPVVEEAPVAVEENTEPESVETKEE